MAADRRLDVTEGKSSLAREVGVVASIAPDGSVVRILAFHHAPDMTKPDVPATLRLGVRNLPFEGAAEVTVWRVDSQHGDFWPQWESDRRAHGIGDDAYDHSRDQPDPAHALKNPADIAFWKSKEPEYQELARMSPPSTERRSIEHGALDLAYEIPCPAVALIEVKKAE